MNFFFIKKTNKNYRQKFFVHNQQSNIESNIHSQQETTAIIEQLWLYPIKSCAGVRIESGSWPCTDDGLAFDRYFTLVDAKGTFLSQKQHPKLSLVKPQLDASTLTLLLTAPHMPTIELNLNEIDKHQNENSGSIVVCGKKKNKTKNEKKKRQK